jgi:hypothetical protein
MTCGDKIALLKFLPYLSGKLVTRLDKMSHGKWKILMRNDRLVSPENCRLFVMREGQCKGRCIHLLEVFFFVHSNRR